MHYRTAQPILLVTSLVAALAALLPREAQAFCLTAYCTSTDDKQCFPEQENDCPRPLFWASPCISYSVQRDASRKVSFGETQALLAQAFGTWMAASCEGNQPPRVQLIETEPVACDEHEYNKDRGNANIILFRDDVWPYDGAASTLALTTVTFDLSTGAIYDADMEINGTTDITTTNDIDEVGVDLLSVLTHEAGHFLGLSHSEKSDATMFATYLPGTISLRALHTDDIAAICTAYPPGEIAANCDWTPRHGFSAQCSSIQQSIAAANGDDDGGCKCSAPGNAASPRSPLAAASLTLLSAIGLRRFRARKRTA